jgi:phospholipase C
MISRRTTAIAASVLAAAVLVVGLLGLSLRGQSVSAATAASGFATTTPIKHIVVIFQENVSFDHYFGTYPVAANPAGEPRFEAAPGTPSVNGLTGALLTNNPNAANPQRLDRSQAVTCDQDHSYTDEQKSFNHGLMDKFVEFVSGGGCTDKSIVMNYYDGNTVTAFWNYAQNFAMSDNSFNTQFGPSSPPPPACQATSRTAPLSATHARYWTTAPQPAARRCR